MEKGSKIEQKLDHFQGMSRREILEMQSPRELIAIRGRLLDQYSQVESDIHLINDILDGYGVGENDEQFTAFPTEDESNIERGRE